MTTDHFKKWYEKNGASHNARRRAAYKSDSGKRQSAIEYQREYRLRNRVRISEGKKGGGVVYIRIGDLANILGKEIVTIRKWEREGVIPKLPRTSLSINRRYSPLQVELLKKFVEGLNVSVPEGMTRKEMRQKASQVLFDNWNKEIEDGNQSNEG